MEKKHVEKPRGKTLTASALREKSISKCSGYASYTMIDDTTISVMIVTIVVVATSNVVVLQYYDSG